MRPCKVAGTIHGFSLGYVAAAASSPSERSRKKASIQPSGLFYISVDSRPCSAQTFAESPFIKRARSFRECRMYRPPLRGRPALPGKKVLLIDRFQATREARAAVLRTHGVEVHEAEEISAARFLWQPRSTISSCSTFADTPRRKRSNSTSRLGQRTHGSESSFSPDPQSTCRVPGPVKSPRVIPRVDSGSSASWRLPEAFSWRWRSK